MLPALLFKSLRGNTSHGKLTVASRPAKQSVRPTRTYYRAGRPYRGQKLHQPIDDVLMLDPFNITKTAMDHFGPKYVRHAIRDPPGSFKKNVMESSGFLLDYPAMAGRHCVAIQMNNWAMDNALDEVTTYRLKDLIYKYCSNQVFFSVIWKPTQKNLCTGLDLYDVYRMLHANENLEPLRKLYRNIYQTSYYLATLDKPFLPILTGCVTGTGAGIALNALFPIATESSRVSFPGCSFGSLGAEAGISFKLSRLPGRLGEYYLVSGKTIHSSDLPHLGLTHHFMPSDRAVIMESTLAEINTSDLPTVLTTMSTFMDQPEETTVLKYLDSINRCFGFDTIPEIMQALREETVHKEWAENTLKRMEEASPLAMAITLRATRLARYLPLLSCINLEYSIMARLVQGQDYVEGVSAFVENRKPNWAYSKPEEVPPKEVEKYLAPLPLKHRLRLDKINPDAVRLDSFSEFDRAWDRVNVGHINTSTDFVNAYGGPFAEFERVEQWAHAELVKPHGIDAYHGLLNREEELYDAIEELADESMDVVNHTSQN